MDNDQPTQENLTRRERRQLERNQQHTGATQSRWLRRLFVWGSVLVVVFFIGWLMVRASRNIALPNASGGLAVPVSSVDHISGPASASITLVEYGDFQCPACGAYYPLVKQTLASKELAGKVDLVFRHFPLTQLHANAQLGAQASEAAALQGKFWQMFDLLYQNQNVWANMSSSGARSQFVQYATSLGLDVNKFSTDIDSSIVKDRVQVDVASGNLAGVNATPTFFVNGTRMPPPNSADEFKQFIVSAGHGATPTP